MKSMRDMRPVTSTFFARLRRVEKCREMLRNVEKCRELSRNVEKCREMSSFCYLGICDTSRNVEKCRVLSKLLIGGDLFDHRSAGEIIASCAHLEELATVRAKELHMRLIAKEDATKTTSIEGNRGATGIRGDLNI